MRKWNAQCTVNWMLIAFFLTGGIGNIFVSEANAANYLRWGYPDGFHVVAGVLELAAAGLLAFSKTRPWGLCLAMVVMLAALVTLMRHQEYLHAIAPLTVITIAGVGPLFKFFRS